MTQTTGATSATTDQVTVEINRTEYIPGAGWWNAEDGDVWERVGDGSTTTESFDPEWDTEDYGTPVVWAAARIRDLSCDHNLEPSVYPLGDAVHERVWLSASYENPYVTERRETSAYVKGVSETDRAEVFRLAMLDGPEWIAVLHAHRYPAPAADAEPVTVTDVMCAVASIQPAWADGGQSRERSTAIADAFRERINTGETVPDHDVHTLWMLERALEWAERDDEDEPGDPPVYVGANDCQWCRTAMTDAAEIEAIEDDRRIFQALCTEHGRLGRLLGYDSENVNRERTARLTATREHTERLRDRYAAKLRELPGTPGGCPCVVLTSGNIHPCPDHAAR